MASPKPTRGPIEVASAGIYNEPQVAGIGSERLERYFTLLDECEARIILLLAPAGYGKTTLARQWAKTLSRVVWVTCTPAHRDVAALAETIANGINDPSSAASRVVRQFVAAHANPQRVGRQISEAVAQQIESCEAQWVVIDDYHELAGAAEAEETCAQTRR